MEEDPIFPCASPPPFLPQLRPPPANLELPWTWQDTLASPCSDGSSTLRSDPRSMSDDGIDLLSSKSTNSLKPVTPSGSPRSPVGTLPSYLQQMPRLPSVPEVDLVADPRDHARLKAAWEAMLASRFLATKLLAVLPFYLSSIFIDIQVQPPLKVRLPPNSGQPFAQRRSADSVSSDHSSSGFSREGCLISSGKCSGFSMESTHMFVSSCATMHLARIVETIKGCKEAVWEEYEKLYSADAMPAVTRTARPESAAAQSAKPSARETFESEWSIWEKYARLSSLSYILT